jgi:hypothetical protein
MPTQDAQITERRKESVGPMVGIVIVVLLLIAGALYFWVQELNRQAKNPPAYIPGDRESSQTQ